MAMFAIYQLGFRLGWIQALKQHLCFLRVRASLRLALPVVWQAGHQQGQLWTLPSQLRSVRMEDSPGSRSWTCLTLALSHVPASEQTLC